MNPKKIKELMEKRLKQELQDYKQKVEDRLNTHEKALKDLNERVESLENDI